MFVFGACFFQQLQLYSWVFIKPNNQSPNLQNKKTGFKKHAHPPVVDANVPRQSTPTRLRDSSIGAIHRPEQQ